MTHPPSLIRHPLDKDWWRDRPVLITGCTGFMGSWLTQTLLQLDAHVVGLARDTVPHSGLYNVGLGQRITTVRGDVRDRALLLRTLNEYEIKTVFHLAAQAIVGVANRSPVTTFEINIAGTWTLLEAARRTTGVEQIIISSSDKAYGAHETLPYTEELPLEGHQPYEVSKACMDLIAQSYATTYGVPVGVARCSNLYGGGDLNWNRIVPGTIRAVLEDTHPEIRSDGTAQRDYLYIEDAVNAYLTFAQSIQQDKNLIGRALNFGSGGPLSVLELVRSILEAADRDDLQPRVLGQPNHEVPVQYLDYSRAAATLGWQPQYSLQDGLSKTVAWYRDYLRDNSRASALVRSA